MVLVSICQLRESEDAVIIQSMGDNKIKYFTFEVLATSNRVQVANLRDPTSDNQLVASHLFLNTKPTRLSRDHEERSDPDMLSGRPVSVPLVHAFHFHHI